MIQFATAPTEAMCGAALDLLPSPDLIAQEEFALTLYPNRENGQQAQKFSAFLALLQEGDNLTGTRLLVVTVPQTLDAVDRFTSNHATLLAERSRRQTAIRLIGVRWERYLFDLGASVDVDDISETVDAVLDVVAQFGPSGISFTGLQSDHVNGEHLAAMLRTTFTWRNQISGWHEALGIAEHALRNAGIEPNEALLGLR